MFGKRGGLRMDDLKNIKFKDAQSEGSAWCQNLFLSAAVLVDKLSSISHLFKNFGLCLNNIDRRQILTGSVCKKPAGLRREALWDLALTELSRDKFIGIELGVAWGYMTSYWVLKSSNIVAWHGFDTFTGLPDAWRHYSEGHFSNEGVPPDINDPRITWHIGLVQSTLINLHNLELNKHRVFISFDLDLFEPTFYALSQLVPQLKEGDLLYFDEPHDMDEGSLVHMLLKFNSDKLVVLGYTPCQLLLKVTGNSLRFPDFNAL
jgi:hypothetical protein